MADIAAAHAEATCVRKATENELPALAAVLARAFYDDPQVRWLIQDDDRRLATAERGFSLFLHRLWFAQDECWTTPAIAGVAIWELPGHWKVGVRRQITMLPAMLGVYGRLFPRVARAVTAMEANHPHEPHYYLPFIGVDDHWRGGGIGAALLGTMLSRCDTEGMPAYLEASSPRNLTIYERHGFAVTEEFRIGKGAPPIWRMWRRPAGG